MFGSIIDYIRPRKSLMWSATPQYRCCGPQGHFYTDDINLAMKLCRLIDPEGDSWTISDEGRE